ncbi:protein CBFA2T2 isoform X2 [Rhinatrema bivittatum]|nr:protein CBFA2T2 isoform X2 [Rhinatrema bivittatum]XP_029466878.1 protein CBFA2T2 isoform X2 [Rhinatrema bivittatum]XP_029466879.1 protein CBFA2T2 isoform X2 [Rhinatrema bivittatum]XP_029466880.1 protein CBFA2T2 isoform X2 [Rhinatrema bivittatum]XP_029466881.1 protein CBFA2T2 isoform X2 [Rhinatrema bivittatum]XP_029466882.1 protein CBFA2T2 isoform X2 [Rhinatrema bivittatum]XP_029466883.1 protein CBFA2T2 isoform X2 [Rhinatrema bivittatum]XP_029466884.1 protein CBFA2T2 isoform X2 [Rhinatrema
MPGSPVEVKIHSRSSPPAMPPLPPVNPSGPRPVSFPPTALSNGMNHSPPTLNGAPSPPQRFSNGPSSSSSSSLTNQQLPATCGARQLSKLKRFLTTLQQFGNDISPEIGEKVRTLVLALVNSTVTIEEFHCKLQEATNFPLRPFVIPFLKANLPLLQRELLHCARAAKQTPSQYLAQHEHLLLNATTASPADSSELLMEVNGNGKRHSPDRREENSFERDPIQSEPPAKRVCTISPAPRHSPALSLPLQFHPTPPPLQHYSLEDIPAPQLYRDPAKVLEHREPRDRHHNPGGINGGYRDELVDHRLTEKEWADEWKHLDHVLNCIMEMVEKTRRSMAVLRRCQEADREELHYWKRRCSENTESRKGGEFVSRQHSPGSSDSMSSDSQREFSGRTGTGYVTEEIWKKAEEAVNEVKRQAMSEVQKAVAEAEHKAFEMIASERARMEQTIADAKRQATEDAFLIINEQEESTESCWNCGRKASETCSGCNIARYCGSFCQHKDWERHHRICGQGLQSQAKPLPPVAGRSATTKSLDAVPSPALDKTSATTSRSSTPASLTAVDSNGL